MEGAVNVSFVQSLMRNRLPKHSLKYSVIEASLVIIFCLFGAIVFQKPWQIHTALFHTMAELICITIAISTFLVAWYTYNHEPRVNHILGFGFLAAAIFNMYHTYFFKGVQLYPNGYPDFSTRYGLISDLLGTLILLISVSDLFKHRFNKYLGLMFVLTFSFSVTQFIHFEHRFLPVLATPQGGIMAKTLTQIGIILIILLTLCRLTKTSDHKYITTYHYISIALLIALPAEISAMFYVNPSGFPGFFAHILRIATYYYLSKGIFVSTITHPYKHMTEVLNELPLGLLTYNEEDCISFVNKRTQELLGFKQEELLGLTAKKFAEKIYNSKDAKSQIQLTIKDYTQVKNKVLVVDNPCSKTKLIVNAQSLQSGSTLYYFDEAKKQQELENLQFQTKTILNSIKNCVLVTDTQDKIITSNQAFEDITEFQTENIIGSTFADIAGILNAEMVELPPEDVLDTVNHRRYSVTITTKNNIKKELITYRTDIQDIDGEIIGGIWIGADLTIIRQQQQKLQQQEKLAVLGQMAAGIVHEIRNPLTTLKGFSQLILEKAPDEQFREYAAFMISTADDVNKVVSDFLTFAKPRPPLLQKVLVGNIISSINLMVDTESFIRGIPLEIIAAQEEKPILADESQLKQVILNIVNNAIDAMGSVTEPKLKLKTEYRQFHHEMVIKISDNGSGMSPADISQAGTPFYTTKEKGTGLGLSICYQMIKEHKGRIEIDSELSKGTTFSIYLPCLTEDTLTQRTNINVPA